MPPHATYRKEECDMFKKEASKMIALSHKVKLLCVICIVPAVAKIPSVC